MPQPDDCFQQIWISPSAEGRHRGHVLWINRLAVRLPIEVFLWLCVFLWLITMRDCARQNALGNARDPSCGLKSIHNRHLQVQDDHIWVQLSNISMAIAPFRQSLGGQRSRSPLSQLAPSSSHFHVARSRVTTLCLDRKKDIRLAQTNTDRLYQP